MARPAFVLNHGTVSNLPVQQLFEFASALGMSGVELRGDLEGSASIWNSDPAEVAGLARRWEVPVVSVSQLDALDRWDDERAAEAVRLADWAQKAGADAIMLSPTLDGSLIDAQSRHTALRDALTGLEPILRERSLVGTIEPVGEEGASVTSQADVTTALQGLFEDGHPFRVTHDTFQYHLSSDKEIALPLLSIVQISGVRAGAEVVDTNRVLPDDQDVTGAVEQVRRILAERPGLPVSFECLASGIGESPTAFDDIRLSMDFVADAVDAA